MGDKDLNKELEYEDYFTEGIDNTVLQIGIGKGDENTFDLPKEHPDYGKNIAAYYFFLFPNMMFNFYPWGLSINVVKPKSPEYTEIDYFTYIWKEELMGKGAGGDLDKVELEDGEIVETVQKGIKSKAYDRGRYSPKRGAECNLSFNSEGDMWSGKVVDNSCGFSVATAGASTCRTVPSGPSK